MVLVEDKVSFNIFIGIDNETINMLDNPYFDLNIVEVDQEWKPRLPDKEKISLKQCDNEKDLPFIPKSYYLFIPNNICIDNKSKLEVKSNWFSETYTSYMFQIDKCKQLGPNKTSDGKLRRTKTSQDKQ